ncbi:MAG TPA: hypothetical protein DD670_18915 [Planctomycetaceae bacterium]|nr:hypothetical protein [Planctomycetaceae bacterium]
MRLTDYRQGMLLPIVATGVLAFLASGSVLASTYSNAVSASAPIAWYRLDDAADQIGSYHGTTSATGVTFGQPAAIQGDPSSAALFAAADAGVITVPDAPELNFGTIGDFSIEFWAKRGEATTSRYAVINKGDTNSGYWMRFDADGKMRFNLDYGATADTAITTGTYADGAWHHYVATADRTSGLKIYVDGQLDGEDSQILGTGSITSVGLPAAMGHLPATATKPAANFLVGSLDEVAVYNAVLTSSQINAHYDEGIGGMGGSYPSVVGTDNPIAWWRMADATDSGSGNHFSYSGLGGVTFGQPTTITGDSPPGIGATGSAVFDGTTESYISVQDADDLNFGEGEDFAVEAWVNVAMPFGELELTENAMIFVKGDTNGSYWLRLEKDGTPRFLLDFGATSIDVRGATGIADGTWHHIVGVADRDVGLELYVDNMLVASKGYFDSNNVSSTLPLQIGMLGTGSAMDGWIDEMAVYNRVLSESEILAHFQAATATPSIPGDADGNNKVDDADAKVLADNWGAGSATRSMGDFDGDGLVGPKDAAILAANWGFGVSEATATAVPEPSTMVVLLGVLAVFTFSRKRE